MKAAGESNRRFPRAASSTKLLAMLWQTSAESRWSRRAVPIRTGTKIVTSRSSSAYARSRATGSAVAASAIRAWRSRPGTPTSLPICGHSPPLLHLDWRTWTSRTPPPPGLPRRTRTPPPRASRSSACSGSRPRPPRSSSSRRGGPAGPTPRRPCSRRAGRRRGNAGLAGRRRPARGLRRPVAPGAPHHEEPLGDPHGRVREALPPESAAAVTRVSQAAPDLAEEARGIAALCEVMGAEESGPTEGAQLGRYARRAAWARSVRVRLARERPRTGPLRRPQAPARTLRRPRTQMRNGQAQAAAALDHPNVVKIYAAGRLADGGGCTSTRSSSGRVHRRGPPAGAGRPAARPGRAAARGRDRPSGPPG